MLSPSRLNVIDRPRADARAFWTVPARLPEGLDIVV
jgi:hypothetical protein